MLVHYRTTVNQGNFFLRKTLISFASAIAVSALMAPGPVSAADSPSDPAVRVIRSFYATLIDVMKRGKELGLEGREKELKPATESAFDLAEITRRSVGPSWTGISDSDKKALVDAVERLTLVNYAKNLTQFSGEQFVVEPEAKDRSENKIVESKLVDGHGSTVAFNYLMHPVDGQWKIVDVYLNGNISQVALRRSDFSSTVQKLGPSGLVDKLNALVNQQIASK
jgi:phospholipid transport system substrate-binding protein